MTSYGRVLECRPAPRAAALVVSVLIAGVTASPASADTITVDVNGGGQFTTILAAIEAAHDGDTILVAPGTYTGSGNHDLNFQGKDLVLESSHGAEQTIIDLDGHGGVFLENSETIAAVISGFTFANAGASRGPIYAWHSSASVRYCVFTGNRANTFFSASSPALIRDCEFIDNPGGALVVGTYDSEVAVRSCLFEGNSARDGGAIGLQGGPYASITVEGCTFIGNSVERHGGAIIASQEGIRVEDCTFTGNRAGWHGGAVQVYDHFPSDDAGPEFARCTFSGNWTAGDGGAIHHKWTSITVTDCLFEGNSAVRGGAVICYENNTGVEHAATFSGCTFRSNRAERGGGVMCVEFAPILDGCLFDSNLALLWGGGICVDGAYEHVPLITHCTFTRSSSHRGGALLANGGARAIAEHCTFYGCRAGDGMIVSLVEACVDVSNSIISFAPWNDPIRLQFATATVEHCVVFGNAGGDSLPAGNPDNLITDPLFCDVYNDDFTLCENSPCLPANNTWGEQVGAHGVGCGNCDSVARAASWGRIKAIYR